MFRYLLFISFVLIHACCGGGIALAQSDNVISTFNQAVGTHYRENFVKNQSFEKNVSLGVVTSGSSTKSWVTSPRLFGQRAVQWLPFANGNTIKFGIKTLPDGLKAAGSNQNCEMFFTYQGGASSFSASDTATVGLYNGATKIVEYPLPTFTDSGPKLYRNTGFIIPCSRAVTDVVVTATGSLFSTLTFDEVFYVQASSIGSVQNSYEATMYRTGGLSLGPNNNDVKAAMNATAVDTGGFSDIANGRMSFKGSYVCSFNGRIGLANTNVLNTYYTARIYKNGSLVSAGEQYLAAAGTYLAVTVKSPEIQINASDYVELYIGSSGNNSSSTLTVVTGSDSTFLSAKCSVPGANAITANNYDYARRSYTPVFSGLGTVTAIDCGESRQGQFNLVDCKFTTGTVTSSEARISLPSGNVVDLGVSSVRLAYEGAILRNDGNTNVNKTGVVLMNGGQGYVTLSSDEYVPAINPLVSQPGSFMGSGTLYNINFKVPIKDWAVTQGAPQLVGSVTSNSLGSLRIEGAYVTNTGSACLVSGSSSSWLGSPANTAVGQCTFSLSGWSTVQCFGNTVTNSANDFVRVDQSIPSVTTLITRTTNVASGGTALNENFNLFCFGIRN